MFVQTVLNNDACIGFRACSFKRAAVLQSNLKKHGVQYSHGISFSQFHLAKMAEITNLHRATPQCVISQSLSSRIQTCLKKFNTALYA